jgi:hypothetical protein
VQGGGCDRHMATVVAAAGSACSGPGASGAGGLQHSGDVTTRWLLLPSSLVDESGLLSPW